MWSDLRIQRNNMAPRWYISQFDDVESIWNRLMSRRIQFDNEDVEVVSSAARVIWPCRAVQPIFSRIWDVIKKHPIDVRSIFFLFCRCVLLAKPSNLLAAWRIASILRDSHDTEAPLVRLAARIIASVVKATCDKEICLTYAPIFVDERGTVSMPWHLFPPNYSCCRRI